MRRSGHLTTIETEGIVGIIRARSADEAYLQAARVLAAGLKVVEVSLTTPGAPGVIERLTRIADGALIGAGTVLTAQDARSVLDAGARLLVSPDLRPDVVGTGVAAGAAVVPGCMTPTEMRTAMSLGATAVKIFPAQVWSPTALAGLRQALPDLPCVPTGGIGPRNAADWIAAGAIAVGVGAALTEAADPRPVLQALRSSVGAARGSDG